MIRQCRFQLFLQKRRALHAYTIFPNVRCEEQENQACYLTKTVIRNELPLSSISLPNEERENLTESIKRSIIETNFFHRDEKVELKRRWTANRRRWEMEKFRTSLRKQVLQNMLRVVWSTESAR